MRKWELITDLFDSKQGEIITDYKHYDKDYGACVLIKSSTGSIVIEPEKYPQHFRLVEEPEFTESDVKDIIAAYSTSSIEEAIETIRKRKVGR